jgi:hypothetical protein
MLNEVFVEVGYIVRLEVGGMAKVIIRARDDHRVGQRKVGRRLCCKVGVDSVTNKSAAV